MKSHTTRGPKTSAKRTNLAPLPLRTAKPSSKVKAKALPAPKRGRSRVPLSWQDDGLLPAVVRDVETGRVLVLAYVNRESLAKTLSTGLVHFWSRKRKALWLKGETSGNVLRLVDAHVDCDRDALLFDVRPAGPACHTGATSCFFSPLVERSGRAARLEPARFGWEELFQLVVSRKKEKPKNSYTTKLFEAGIDRIAQKVGEEAVETIIAARQGEPALFIGEVADLLYHVTVLMAAVGVTPEQVNELLRERHEVIEKKRNGLASKLRTPSRKAKSRSRR